ncbi:ATP synthase F0 subunit A [Enterococcus faecium MRSN 3418]|uniref:ClC family H(+)/Cl(-) exchange transporter n=1 Tax=Enterococcus faecium TaxID=1352 RepID=UPI0006277878|nr:ClC family H(+)/Cl(-) exchange transporter [Enterococcus faecium]KKJ69896.1 ATP synthase F0 subunit A [Enterococcus faecium MRSN 3418]
MEKKGKIKKLDKTQIYFILKGIFVGLLTGIVVSLFRLSIETLSDLVRSIYEMSREQPIYLIGLAICCILAAFFVGYLVKNEPDIKGSGIPQVVGQLRGELSMNWFSVLWKKFIGGVLSVGAGLFLGREGPSIQLGASIGQGAGQLFRSPSSEEKILISSGASSGLAAAFNAPIAGLLFVLEEIHHSFSPLVWLTSFASAITANFVSLYFFGLRPVLYLGDLPSLPLKYYGSLVILGVLLGILGFIYQNVLLALPKFYNRLPLPAYFHGFVPFLLILPIGYLWPSTLGGGNQIVLAFGHASLPIIMIIGLFVLRFVFSMISYGGGLPGGIFLPILTLGALIGSFYGNIMVDFGMDPIYIKDFVVIAMAGYFTAIGKAPLTAIILVTEMVGSLNHLMPLGLAALVAYIVNDLLGGNPIYESLLERLLGNTQTASLKGARTTFDFPVTAESSLDGLMVRDFNWPKNMLLISIRRGNQEILTHGDTIMNVGDILVILTDEANLPRIKQEIEAKSSITNLKQSF